MTQIQTTSTIGRPKKIANHSTSDTLLTQWFACATETVDITDLDLSRLPSVVQAQLYTEADRLDAPELVEARQGIVAPNVTNFNLQKLRIVGDVILTRAKDFNMPELKIAGWILAPNVENFNAPELETIKVRLGFSAKTIVNAPKLPQDARRPEHPLDNLILYPGDEPAP